MVENMKVRLTLNIPLEVAQVLEEVSKAMGINKTTIIVNGLKKELENLRKDNK
jgi:predicted DNA-binding protein